ncbi:MAG TPA: complex I NDUFA9 subunit family protein [Thermoanaerobaculia bacterium]|nr:complex I NDUFA9 subunit family protein [Thermoanaerobaculia bacterium]
MKIAITGGTGFVGGRVVDELLRRGHEPVVLAREPDATRSRFNRPVTTVAGSISDVRAIERAVGGSDAVIHLVGVINESEGVAFDEVHRQGPENVVAAMRKAGVRRLLHMSAMGSSADAPSKYGRTKAAGEEAVRRSGLDATIFRPSIIFGPGDGFVTLLAKIVRANPGFIPVIGRGTVRFMPVSVRDVARVFADAIEKPETAGRTFEVGGPETLTLNDIYREIAAAVGKPNKPIVHLPLWWGRVLATAMAVLPEPPLTRDQLRSLTRDNVGDTAATNATFGAPAVRFAEGIREYVRPRSRRDSTIGI